MTVDALTILAVDDNAAVQDLIDQALRERGHRVLSTRDPREVLAIAQRLRLDVLIIGRIVESHGSPVDELLSLQPDVRVIDLHADSQRPVSLDDLCSQVAALATDQRDQTADLRLAPVERDPHL